MYMDFFLFFPLLGIEIFFKSGLIRAVNSSNISAAWKRFWLVAGMSGHEIKVLDLQA